MSNATDWKEQARFLEKKARNCDDPLVRDYYERWAEVSLKNAQDAEIEEEFPEEETLYER